MLVISRPGDSALNVETAWPWWCAADAPREPRRFLSMWSLASTPLLRMDYLAKRFGVAGVHIKDETARLGLGSFKALGGAYAVMRMVHTNAEAHMKRRLEPGEIFDGPARELSSNLTFCCATDGNHGRSVAAGARAVGAACYVFLHEGVNPERVRRITEFGAHPVRVAGSYDDSVAAAASEARRRGWTLVPDTTVDPASEDVCGFVMQGYSIMVDELLEQTAAHPPSHLIVQAGVGGLAASIFGHWSARSGAARRPRFVVVEAENTACLQASASAGSVVRLPAAAPTVMAMLECQSPSPQAWPVVQRLADAYIAVTDAEALAAVRLLAEPGGSDPATVAGPSGAAGLAGLAQICASPSDRDALDLNEDSSVLLIATEAGDQIATLVAS